MKCPQRRRNYPGAVKNIENDPTDYIYISTDKRYLGKEGEI